MPYIRSTAPDQAVLSQPGEAAYSHPVVKRAAHAIPVAFQVTSPYDYTKALLPHALVMHVNPSTFGENFNKKIERIQTRGGFVEQHWGDELGEISADAPTGAFINLYTGLSSVVRQRTIAWDRYRDLYDLYRNNGSVYDPTGAVVLQGNIMLMYDRGTYIGTFRNFSVDETDDSPFMFKLSFTFKVERTIYQVPFSRGGYDSPSPPFQSTTTGQSVNAPALEENIENERVRAEAQARFNEAAARFDAEHGLTSGT